MMMVMIHDLVWTVMYAYRLLIRFLLRWAGYYVLHTESGTDFALAGCKYGGRVPMCLKMIERATRR